MKLGIFTDGLLHLPFEQALDAIVGAGIQAVEIGTGNFSPAPHCNMAKLLADDKALATFQDAIHSRGLTISALNCSGNPLHPRVDRRQHDDQVTRDTILLAERLGVNRLVLMTGCPGTPTSTDYPNWVTATWPEDFIDLLNWQWDSVAIPYWTEIAAFAELHGVNKLCFELHPGMLAYNVSSLERLRSAVGSTVGANLDPSHFFYQSMDAIEIIKTLGDAIYYVHAKDARVDPRNTAIYGALDMRFPLPPRDMTWVYRTVGYGHGAEYWADFVSALKSIGYDDVLSIEHEDPLIDADLAVARAANLLNSVIV
jgi:sugar phosphate isomerase/epimerase